MLKRLLILCVLFALTVTTAFAAAPVKQSPVKVSVAACDLSQSPSPITFTKGLEECSPSQVKQMYLLFSDALQNVGDGDEFSVEIPYDVGMCADRRWISARTSSGTIYCWNACECTENGDSCHAECVYIP